MTFGVILLPDPDTSERLIAYSRDIAAASAPLMALGPDAPPHVTLCHAHCSHDTADAWWSAVKGAVTQDLTLDRCGLIFQPIPAGDFYVPSGGVSAGVEITRRDDLNRAHLATLDAARRLKAEPIGAVGEDFRPHITLGIMAAFPTGPVPFASGLVMGAVSGRLALGELGPCGTFPRILETA